MRKDELSRLFKIFPQSPGIMGKSKYMNSSVIVPLVLVDDEYHFLFQQRAKEIRQGGEICFPGGKFDPAIDQDLKQTAVRETIEEIGIPAEKIRIIGQLDTLVSILGVTIDSFVSLLHIKHISELRLNHKEVESVFTLPMRYFINHKPAEYEVKVEVQSEVERDGEKKILFPAKALGLPAIYHKAWGSQRHKILVYEIDNRMIWGLTAEIVYELSQKIVKFYPENNDFIE